MTNLFSVLTLFSDSLHQHVELVHEYLLFTVHQPGEALFHCLACTNCISHTALQLFCCFVAHKSVEFWDTWWM